MTIQDHQAPAIHQYGLAQDPVAGDLPGQPLEPLFVHLFVGAEAGRIHQGEGTYR
jgi:hypothetical protein